MIGDIYRSYRSMPSWVQIWVGIILVPVNLAAIFFLNQPGGELIAFLAIGGMAPNAFFLFYERGFGRIMALSHLVFWIPLVFILWQTLGRAGPYSDAFLIYIKVLLTVDLISLAFDIPDTWRWIKGQRAVAGREDS